VVVSSERRPASVWILRLQQKTVSPVSDVCGLRPKRKHRIARRLHYRLSRGHKCGPGSARKLSMNKGGGQVAEDHK
jgi:hypothetical protein